MLEPPSEVAVVREGGFLPLETALRCPILDDDDDDDDVLPPVIVPMGLIEEDECTLKAEEDAS